MSPSLLMFVLLAMSAAAYHLGRRRAMAAAGSQEGLKRLHSRPVYHGALLALVCAVPAVALAALWLALDDTIIAAMVVSAMSERVQSLPPAHLNLLLNDVRNIVLGNITSGEVTPDIRAAVAHYRSLQGISSWMMTLLVLGLGIGGSVAVRRRITVGLRARSHVERVLMGFLMASSLVAIATTVGIIFSVLFESWRFFQSVPAAEFLFGLDWSPQIAIRADQAGSSGAFGAVPLFAGTMLIACIAMLVAVPIGLMSAIYLAEYATPRFRAWTKPMLEVLAGIPTVVYGFFAALVVAPKVRGIGESIGLDVASESALAAGLVMGVMIIPFVSSLSDDVIRAVPQAMRDGSYGMGATKSETIRLVIVPAALPGIVGGVLLAVSRAIGETMIVVMAAGLAANLTANPLHAVTTVTAQIVTLLVGDQEFDSPKTLAAFALGLMLFLVTLVLNVIALYVVRRYREQYE